MPDPKPTTPVDTPILPGGHRMHSMDIGMAIPPSMLKDTPIEPTNTQVAPAGTGASEQVPGTAQPATAEPNVETPPQPRQMARPEPAMATPAIAIKAPAKTKTAVKATVTKSAFKPAKR